jgi:hypothetical protein
LKIENVKTLKQVQDDSTPKKPLSRSWGTIKKSLSRDLGYKKCKLIWVLV